MPPAAAHAAASGLNKLKKCCMGLQSVALASRFFARLLHLSREVARILNNPRTALGRSFEFPGKRGKKILQNAGFSKTALAQFMTNSRNASTTRMELAVHRLEAR
jgi:hypothetical protein